MSTPEKKFSFYEICREFASREDSPLSAARDAATRVASGQKSMFDFAKFSSDPEFKKLERSFNDLTSGELSPSQSKTAADDAKGVSRSDPFEDFLTHTIRMEEEYENYRKNLQDKIDGKGEEIAARYTIATTYAVCRHVFSSLRYWSDNGVKYGEMAKNPQFLQNGVLSRLLISFSSSNLAMEARNSLSESGASDTQINIATAGITTLFDTVGRVHAANKQEAAKLIEAGMQNTELGKSLSPNLISAYARILPFAFATSYLGWSISNDKTLDMYHKILAGFGAGAITSPLTVMSNDVLKRTMLNKAPLENGLNGNFLSVLERSAISVANDPSKLLRTGLNQGLAAMIYAGLFSPEAFNVIKNAWGALFGAPQKAWESFCDQMKEEYEKDLEFKRDGAVRGNPISGIKDITGEAAVTRNLISGIKDITGEGAVNPNPSRPSMTSAPKDAAQVDNSNINKGKELRNS